MDNIKTGRFIAEKRKEKNLTQKTLAEKIGVTDKAISKWERGLSYPDVSLLIPLSEELGVSVTELLNGDSIDEMEVGLSDGIVVSSVQRYTKISNQKARRIMVVVILIFLLLMNATFIYGKAMERRNNIDIVFSDLLCEIELSFDYGQDFVKEMNDEACRCLDVSTSNSIRLIERYKAMLYMSYGESVNSLESELDALHESVLSVHHSVPETPFRDVDHSDINSKDMEEGFELIVRDIESLKTAIEALDVYCGSEELLNSVIKNLKSKEVIS